MIEYFIRPMDGVAQRIGLDDLIAYRSSRGMSFRTAPAGRGRADRRRHAEPAAGLRARQGARQRSRSSSPSPGRTCWPRRCIDHHYGDRASSRMAIADVLAEQVQAPGRRRRPGRRGQPARPPRRMGMGRGGDQPRARRRCEGDAGRPPVLRQLRRPDRSRRATGTQLIDYLNALHVDHLVLECAHRPAEELAAFSDLKPRDRLGLGVVDIKRTEIESAGRDRAQRSSAPRHVWARAACATSTPTAASGC